MLSEMLQDPLSHQSVSSRRKPARLSVPALPQLTMCHQRDSVYPSVKWKLRWVLLQDMFLSFIHSFIHRACCRDLGMHGEARTLLTCDLFTD